MPQDRPFRLLDLPLEVRSMIFSEMLVDEKWIYDWDDDVTPRKENVGCIKIEPLEPSMYDSLSMKRTSFLVGRFLAPSEHDFTTYTLLTGKGNIRILQTNSQIYREASAIFYSQNMFYAGGRPSSAVAVPFMKDRGTRSLDSLRRLSIMYPSAMVDPDAVNGGEYQVQGIVGDERRWEDLCCYISLHLPRLAHLDLRVDRAHGAYFKHHDYTMDAWKSLQTAGDFPPKRRKELATLRPDTKLTVSGGGLGWADLDALETLECDDYEDVLFAPLRPWLEESIRRFRTRNISFLDSERARQLVIRRFWVARRKARMYPTYSIEYSDDSDDSDDEQTDGWSEDVSDELELERNRSRE